MDAPRSTECWCDGAGGEYRYHDIEAGESYFGRYCSCAKGRALEKHELERLASARKDRIPGLIESKWLRSGIPATYREMRLETFPRPKPGLIDRLRLARPEQSIFFTGPVGAGKTGLAVGYARSWLAKTGARKSLAFISLPRLLRTIRSSFNGDGMSEGAILDHYGSAGLLILDDLGAENAKAEWLQDILYDLVGARHDEGLPLVVTSNLSLGELAAGKVGERIASRLAAMCRDWEIVVTGDDIRMAR